MYGLLTRWVPWRPAAFVGGLFFGFSPFVLVSLALGHPNFGLLAAVPLIIGCLEALFGRGRRSAVAVGVALGLLVTVQFFISVEVLLLLVLFSAVTAVLVASWAVARRPGTVRPALERAWPGLAVAAGVAAVLLAYPLWFFFAGPAHLVGRAWPDSPAGTVTNSASDFVSGFISAPLTAIMHTFGGYQGPALPLLCFLGIGLVVVLVGGTIAYRHDHRLWLFGGLGAVAVVLSLGVSATHWTPWRLFTHLPVLNNVVPVNISVVIDTCGAVMLGVILGHVRASTGAGAGDRSTPAAAVAGAVAALAVVPIAVALWPNLPMTVRPVTTPRWFRTAAGTASSRVVLPYPAALGGIQSSMAWQASADLAFSMVGGGGPGIAPSRAGPESAGFEVLARASLPLSPAPEPTAANLTAIRRALAGWGVTTVVVPDEPGLPSYDRGRSVPYAVGLFTAAWGEAPVHRADAWVWEGVPADHAPVPLSGPAFARCLDEPPGVPTGAATAECVLRGG